MELAWSSMLYNQPKVNILPIVGCKERMRRTAEVCTVIKALPACHAQRSTTAKQATARRKPQVLACMSDQRLSAASIITHSTTHCLITV
jgi:hypothetical protein